MKTIKGIFPLIIMLFISCTSTKDLTYLNELPDSKEAQFFAYDLPDYKVQFRDILYIDVKITNPDGKIENVLQGSNSLSQSYIQGESNQYLLGYTINREGNISLPIAGNVNVGGKTLSEIKNIMQIKIDSIYKHAFIDVKLLSFKFTVLGEARTPGTFFNYNDYLTIFEAVGRAGGVGDYGRRDRVLIVRSTETGSKTYRVDLKNPDILSSNAYFVMPNDVIIIETVRHKVFNMNLPTISFTISALTSAITTTLLFINFYKK